MDLSAINYSALNEFPLRSAIEFINRIITEEELSLS